jgi:anti-sigma regulatory factor (Ser/Thr protein kinase)
LEVNVGLSKQIYMEISDSSHVGDTRRRAAQMAAQAGLDESTCGKVSVVATELATNIFKNTRQGGILLQETTQAPGLELIAVDAGPGMADIGKCLADGYSSAGTAGNGLGAVQRMSDEFDIWSAPSGTAILSRVLGQQSPEFGMKVGGVCIAMKGESACGDAWAMRQIGTSVFVVMVDGLGHGEEAAHAAQSALAQFMRSNAVGTKQLLEEIHSSMHGTRGGAVAVAKVDFDSAIVYYCAVGNIAGRLQTAEGSRGLVSHNGIAGGQFRKLEEFRYPWTENAVLILHSDGLQTRWALEDYPGLMSRHPGIIAAVLFRDFSRGRDDVTVFAISLPATKPKA